MRKLRSYREDAGKESLVSQMGLQALAACEQIVASDCFANPCHDKSQDLLMLKQAGQN